MQKKREVQGTPGTILRYGCTGRGRVVRSSGWQWTDEAEAVFFETLAATCNVTMAADAAGYATPTVYRQRKMRADFAAKWDAALAQGYARVEMALVRAAGDSLEGVAWDDSRPIPKMSVQEALMLLARHGPSVRGERGGPGRRATLRSMDDIREGLVKKVEAIIAARGLDEKAPPPSTGEGTPTRG